MSKIKELVEHQYHISLMYLVTLRTMYKLIITQQTKTSRLDRIDEKVKVEFFRNRFVLNVNSRLIVK